MEQLRGCLPLRRRALIRHLSSSDTHRKVARESAGDQGFTPVIIMMPWDVML